MTSQADLDLAIMSMHAYNVGADPHMNGLDGDIGDFHILNRQSNTDGFAAYAFSDGAQTVIAYRGTNFSDWTDINHGWSLGAALGVDSTPQAIDAVNFYKAVVSGISGADLYSAPVTLTGHSLGGGLAGYIAETYGKTAVIYDAMPFGASAELDHGLVTAPDPTPAGEDDLALLYPDGLAIHDLSLSGITGWYTDGEVLSSVRSSVDGASTPLQSYANVIPSLAPIEMHSIALHVDLQWVSLHAADVRSLWTYGAHDIFQAYFDKTPDSVGERNVEATESVASPDGSPTESLDEAIAYSAISGGIAPFGDVALKAMFDDAADIGTGYVSQNVFDLFTGEADLLGKIAVEYAGHTAFAAVLSGSNADAANGVLSVSANQSTLSVNFGSDKWTFGGNEQESSYKHDIIDYALTHTIGHDAFDSALQWYTLNAAPPAGGSTGTDEDYISSVSYQLDHAGSYTADGPAQGLNLLFVENGSGGMQTQGTHDEMLVGSDSSEAIWGGNETDIIFGGAGDDDLRGGGQDDWIDGGQGNDDILGSSSDTNGSVLHGGDGNDTIISQASLSNIMGGNGDDTIRLVGDQSGNDITGGPGNDLIDLRVNRDNWITINFASGDGHDHFLLQENYGSHGFKGDNIAINLTSVNSSDVEWVYEPISIFNFVPQTPATSDLGPRPGHENLIGGLALVIKSTGDSIYFDDVKGSYTLYSNSPEMPSSTDDVGLYSNNLPYVQFADGWSNGLWGQSGKMDFIIGGASAYDLV